MNELIRTVAEHQIATVLLTLCFTGCVYRKGVEMSERKKCTKDNPSDGTPYEWYHPDAELISSHDYYDVYLCPHCKIKFDVTVPD
jgi:hypothetical protein